MKQNLSVNDRYPAKEMVELFVAIMHLKTKDEAVKFFRDLMTLAELKEFSNCWQMVKYLVQGKSYTDIARKLKVSTTTVTRVAHWLNHGLGGYKLVASRILKSSPHKPRA